MTCGNVLSKLSEKGAWHSALFGPSNVNLVAQADVEKRANPGVLTAPILETDSWLLNDARVSNADAVQAYIEGASGTTSVELVQWGATGTMGFVELDGLRANYLAGNPPNAATPGDGRDAHSYAVPSRSINGFVDYLRLPPQAAYKGVICSVAQYDKLGTSILVIDALYRDKFNEKLLGNAPGPVQDPIA